ncbi:MAG: hypothetical protein GC206_13445 [Alphaproteobacteria bacterium]|nr:hypothetical protein [Alphaproteobacteria bacterium]
MAVAVENRYIGSNASLTGGNALNVSVAVSGAANSCLLIFIHSSGSGATISAISRDGQTPTLVGSTSANSGADNLRVYRLLAPNSGTANLSVTLSATSEIVVEVYVLTGVDQTTPFGTLRTDSASASGNKRSIGFESFVDGLGIGAAISGTTASAARTVASADGIPDYIASGTLSVSSSVTSRTPSAAITGRMRGDLLLCVTHSENSATHGISGAGWNILTQHTGPTSLQVSYAWRIYDGSDVNPTVSWTGSADASSRVHLFRDTRASGTPINSLGTHASGTTTTHTSTGANTTVADVLAFYYGISRSNTAAAQPSGWTERFDAGSATGPTGHYGGDKNIATSGTGSGDISITAGGTEWLQKQLEILPHANGDQTHGGEVEALGNFTTYASAYETGAAYNCIGFDWTTGTTLYYMIVGIGVNPAAADDNEVSAALALQPAGFAGAVDLNLNVSAALELAPATMAGAAAQTLAASAALSLSPAAAAGAVDLVLAADSALSLAPATFNAGAALEVRASGALALQAAQGQGAAALENALAAALALSPAASAGAARQENAGAASLALAPATSAGALGYENRAQAALGAPAAAFAGAAGLEVRVSAALALAPATALAVSSVADVLYEISVALARPVAAISVREPALGVNRVRAAPKAIAQRTPHVAIPQPRAAVSIVADG